MAETKKVTVITPQVKITHDGKDTVLDGSDAGAALAKLQNYNGVGSILLYAGNKAFTFCCGDTFEVLASKTEDKDIKAAELDCADETMLKAAPEAEAVKKAEDTKPKAAAVTPGA